MPFFCFIVYNGPTLCLFNVIGPINVFGTSSLVIMLQCFNPGKYILYSCGVLVVLKKEKKNILCVCYFSLLISF